MSQLDLSRTPVVYDSTGVEATLIELAALNCWRIIVGMLVALTSSQMPSGGNTESVALVYVDATQQSK